MALLLAVCWSELLSMDTSLVITGCHLIKGNNKKLYYPHLDNFYEQYLYEIGEKKTGISHYFTHRFKDSGFKNHLEAVEVCFDQLIKNSGLHRKINKKRSSRVGVIYFDQYGPVSFFNQDAQIKEMYYSDVFPSFILNSHNISGYSIRLRAERSAFFQAVETAQSLIEDDVLDMIIIGGVHQCIPYLFLTDVVDDYQWMKDNRCLTKNKHHELSLADATGFVLLESPENAQERSADILATVESLKCQLRESQKEVTEGYDNSAFCYPFFRQSVSEDSGIKSDFGPDMGCINLMNRLHSLLQDKPQQLSDVISSTDRDGYAWSLQLNINPSI